MEEFHLKEEEENKGGTKKQKTGAGSRVVEGGRVLASEGLVAGGLEAGQRVCRDLHVHPRNQYEGKGRMSCKQERLCQQPLRLHSAQQEM